MTFGVQDAVTNFLLAEKVWGKETRRGSGKLVDLVAGLSFPPENDSNCRRSGCWLHVRGIVLCGYRGGLEREVQIHMQF